MNQDLKIIKKKYGEKMAHLCRELFPTLLETDGLLLKLLLDNFEPNHNLYEDIVEQKKEDEFKNYIYSLVDVEKNNKIKARKTPEELLREVGYDLFECKSEEDIQKFKKYYAYGEELCTFRGGRLNRCHVFFAVKKNVSDIKRENYSNPERQDEYGTSVLSIQFTRDGSHTLSIKNRYNHTVNNPDSTYSNNLDNIISGLTESFGKYYGLVQQHSNSRFELLGYVRAGDGKYYKYNQGLNNVYYCPNNIIIDNFEVKRFEKEKYIVFDYFILDLVNKEVRLYDEDFRDSFPSTIHNIQKIEVIKKGEEKEIIINLPDTKIIVSLNKENQMIKLDYPKIEQVGNGFLKRIELKYLNMANLQKVGCDFLYYNSSLEELELPSLEETSDNFLICNRKLISKLNLPSLQIVGRGFLEYNISLKKLSLPSLRKVGDYFLAGNQNIEELDAPLLEEVGNRFLSDNRSLKKLDLPLLKKVGRSFLFDNEILEEVNLPSLEEVGEFFLECHPTFTKEDFIVKFKR